MGSILHVNEGVSRMLERSKLPTPLCWTFFLLTKYCVLNAVAAAAVDADKECKKSPKISLKI